MSQVFPAIADEARRLVEAAEQEGIHLRLVGGLAIHLQCPSARLPALQRSYADMDMLTDREGGLRLGRFFHTQGYVANRQLNTLNGDRRQQYYDETFQRFVDVFIGDFEMCHKIPLGERLTVEPFTLPLAELFLTKAQIVELNHKDALDLLALLLDYPIGEGDKAQINKTVIASLCAKDWGLYTTINLTLHKLETLLEKREIALDATQIAAITSRIGELLQAMETAPKTIAWQARARIGTRLRWYAEVEEVRR
jgi:hypothetical protein